MSYKSSLYILDITSLLGMVCKYSKPFSRLGFHFLHYSFCFCLMYFHLFIFTFAACAFWCHIQKKKKYVKMNVKVITYIFF